MKVTTDACLFGAWVAERVRSRESLVISRGSEDRIILDIGAGTGLLPLMAAQKNNFLVDAIEIDKDAFEQSSGNSLGSPWANRIKIFHADVKGFEFSNQYDVIISNPPFYEKELKGDEAKKNIAHHNEGLRLPELLSIIKKSLKSDGSFYLLLPFKRYDEITKLIMESDLTVCQLTFIRQSTKHDYFRIMLEGSFKTKETEATMIDEISIKEDPASDKSGQYTSSFIHLLKDYYLHL